MLLVPRCFFCFGGGGAERVFFIVCLLLHEEAQAYPAPRTVLACVSFCSTAMLSAGQTERDVLTMLLVDWPPTHMHVVVHRGEIRWSD